MILGRLRLLFVARISAACLGIAAFAHPVPAQVFEPDGRRPRPDGPPNAAMVVAGRIKDAGGKPVPGARVIVMTSELARSARPTGVWSNALPLANECHGPRVTDEQGRFELVVPGSRSGVPYTGVRMYAAAPGHGAATTVLRPASGRQEVELNLGPEHLVRGRLVDLKGQPAVGARVRVVQLESPWWLPPRSLSIWAPTTTDDRGLFLIRGLGSGKVCLQIEGEMLTPQRSEVDAVLAESAVKVTLAVSPAKQLRGRVVFADTGKAAAGATIISVASRFGEPRWLEARTDADGRFAINPFAPNEKLLFGRPLTYFLNVFPPPNAPYTVAEVTVPASGAPAQDLKVELRRGVLVRGRVIEAGSGEPVAGARVQYIDRGGDHFAAAIEPARLNTAVSGPDGRFELPVPPEPAHVLILGPTRDYVPVETSVTEIAGGKPGGKRLYADAVVALGPGPEGSERTLDVRLRRGVTLRGKVQGPDDKPAESCVLFSNSYRVNGYGAYCPIDLLQCADGRFELPGCDPDRTHTAHLLDLGRRLGATVELTKKNATEPATVRLLPCGSARAQLVDTDGKPLAKYRPEFNYLLTEGATRDFYLGNNDYALEAVSGTPASLDWEVYGRAETDDDGRVTFPALVPGARYMFHWPPKDLADPKPWPRLEFTVGPGEAKDLGKVVIDHVVR